MTIFGLDGLEETLHLLQGIGNQHCLEVITPLQAMTDTCCDGIHVLQHR